MTRLRKNQQVPELIGSTYAGKKINLKDYLNKPLILSFYRYAGCQLCNLRMNRFISQYHDVYKPAGINALAVFQSPTHKMEKNLYKHHDIPFDVISDPKMKWYKAFGVETSWGGFMKTMFKPLDFIASTVEGYANIDPDGPMNRLPADFLISSDGKIEETFYASHISEHIPFERIEEWMDKS